MEKLKKCTVKELIEMLINRKIKDFEQVYFEVNGCYFYVEEMKYSPEGVEFYNNYYEAHESYSYNEYIYIDE